MAAEVIVKVTTQGGEETLKNINEIKDALGRLESEASNLDLGSDAFEQSKTQIDELKRKLESLGKSQRQLDDDISRGAEEQSSKRAARMEEVGNNLAKFAAGVTDAFAGAFIAFGAGEEDAKKFNETLTKGIGVAMGVKGAIEAFNAATKLATPIQKAFNAAMAANPVGAVVVVIAALAAGIYLLITAMKEEETQSQAVTDALHESGLAHLNNQKLLEDIARKRKTTLGQLSELQLKKLEVEDAASDRMLENEKKRRQEIADLVKSADGADKLRARRADYETKERGKVIDTEYFDLKKKNDKFRAELQIINDKWNAVAKESGKVAFDAKVQIDLEQEKKDKENAQKNKETAAKNYQDRLAEQERLRISLLEGRTKELEEQKANFKEQSKIANDGLKTTSELEQSVIEDNKKKINEINKKWDDIAVADNLAMMKTIEDAYIENEQDEEKRAIKKAFAEQQNRDVEINKTIADEELKNKALKSSSEKLFNELNEIYKNSLAKKQDIKNRDDLAAAEIAVLEKGNELNDLITQLTLKRDIELQNTQLTANERLLIEKKYLIDKKKLEDDDAARRKKEQTDYILGQVDNISAAFKRLDNAAGDLGSSIVSNLGSAFEVMSSDAASNVEKIQAALNGLNSILGAVATYNNEVAEKKVEQNEKELEDTITNLDAQKEAELSKEGLTADQKIEIENRYAQQKYALELQQYKNNTEIKRKAFEQDKNLRIAQAVISTISGVVAAVNGIIAATGGLGIGLAIATGVAVAAMGAIQIANIEKQKFDAGTPPAAPTLQVPSGPGAGGEGTTGARQGPELYAAGGGDTGVSPQGFRAAAPPPQKVYVVSQEVTSSQNMDAVIERRSSF